MIIRATATVALLSLLILVLYLPAAYPPERFQRQLRIEHAMNVELWGRMEALHILSRMLDLHDNKQQVSPIPSTFTAAPIPAIDVTVGAQLSQMTTRVVDNPYAHSLDALLALSTFRFVILTNWLPLLLVFSGAAIIDGAMRRIVKSKEFLQHAPERYALHGALLVLTACLAVVALVVPVTVHPGCLVAVPAMMGALAGRALADFHVRS